MASREESILQRYCVGWFRSEYEQWAGLLFAIPNGGKRSKATAGILKGEGVLPGVADLFLAQGKVEYTYSKSIPEMLISSRVVAYGLFIEMKTPTGVQSKEQIAFQKAVEDQGYQYSIARTPEEFEGVIRAYLQDFQ